MPARSCSRPRDDRFAPRLRLVGGCRRRCRVSRVLGFSASSTSITVGTSISLLADGVADDLSKGHRVTLGFECPLFIHISDEPEGLTKARDGEGNRPWSAAGGCGSLATGLAEYSWIFEKLKTSTKIEVQPIFDWSEFSGGAGNLFVWEAFVSRKAKETSHIDDATAAARAFWSSIPNVEESTMVTAERPFSLVGAALLRAGLSNDVRLLKQTCVVISA